MNILLITSLYPGYKNQARTESTWAIHNFVVEWQKQGHKVKVIVPWRFYLRVVSFGQDAYIKRKYSYKENFIMDGVEILRLPIKKIPRVKFSKKAIYKAVKEIKNYLKRQNFEPDIILAHYADPSGVIAERLKRNKKIPFIMGIHKSDYFFQKRDPAAFSRILNSCDGIVFRSKKLSKIFRNKVPFVEKTPTAIIPSGINSDIILSGSEINMKSQRSSRKIITVCRLDPMKNVDILIKAFSKINRNDLVLKIVGNGKELSKLKKLSKKEGVPHLVEFKGRMKHKDVIKEMKKADVFAMVSSPETFGIVYLEAMASGCITIGSKGEGIDGIIKNGYNGFLVEPRDIEQLKEVLSKTINISQKEKKEILTNSLNTVCELTEKKVSRKYINFIDSCIK
jgi:glycosyltransferase involved in cell wall biosynthesis